MFDTSQGPTSTFLLTWSCFKALFYLLCIKLLDWVGSWRAGGEGDLFGGPFAPTIPVPLQQTGSMTYTHAGTERAMMEFCRDMLRNMCGKLGLHAGCITPRTAHRPSACTSRGHTISTETEVGWEVLRYEG